MKLNPPGSCAKIPRSQDITPAGWLAKSNKFMPETASYSKRFQDPDAVAAYDAKEYGAGSYSSCMWELQRPVVLDLVRQFRDAGRQPLSLLDFACGTGRVLACLEPLADVVEGVDISEKMVAVARTHCVKARLQVGDILTQPELLQKKYDLITAFRFLLNVEPEIRGRVLRRLREVIREPDGMLLVNVHGNSRSLRHPAIVWRRWREQSRQPDVMLNELSPDAARALLRDCGFQVVRQFGFGVTPPTLYRTPLRGLAAAVDRSMAGDNWCHDWSIDMLFVCRPC
jgi:SAM-dependent methyltransferase